MNKILFKMFGADNRWLQKRLVQSVVKFNKTYPFEFTCPVVRTDWGKAGEDWYTDKMEKYTGRFDTIPFYNLAVQNRTSTSFERAKFLQQLAKDYE